MTFSKIGARELDAELTSTTRARTDSTRIDGRRFASFARFRDETSARGGVTATGARAAARDAAPEPSELKTPAANARGERTRSGR